jgi:hypothetical protein
MHDVYADNATHLWQEFAKRWHPGGSHSSVEVLLHVGALRNAQALKVLQYIERERQDLARKIAMGLTVTVSHDGTTMTINLPAPEGVEAVPEAPRRDDAERAQPA